MNPMRLIAGAVLNSLWQAVIVAFLVWVSLRFLQPRVNAATRHVIWWLALGAIVLLPCLPRMTLPIRESQAQPAAAAALPIRVSPPLAPPVLAVVTVTEAHTATWPFWLLALWAAVFLVGCLRIARSFVHLRGLKRRARVLANPLPGIARPARLLVSSEISSPIAAGFIHPAVILPATLCDQLTAEELDCVLLHESAHLARYDDWLNVLARLLGAAMMLHPVAWWTLRQIEREREMACDDWVVAHMGLARSYAQSLARVAELRVEPGALVLSLGIVTSRSRLRRRIEMLLQRGRTFSPSAAWKLVGAAALVLVVLTVAGALAPHWIAFAQRLQFEVASVKQNADGGQTDGMTPRRSGDLVMFHNTQVYTLICYAYHVIGNYQVVGFVGYGIDPGIWFDVDARTGVPATDDQVRLMMQSLLEDRFKLKVHRETRNLPGYELSIGSGKVKLTPFQEGAMKAIAVEGRTLPPPRPGSCGTGMFNDGAHLACHAVGIDTIIANVSNELKSPVADRTGLMGTYDLHLVYVPEHLRLNPDTPPGPSLEKALQNDLGLALKKGTAPVEVIVIDHWEKPSEN